MEALFDRFAQAGFAAAFFLRVAQLFGMNASTIEGLAAVAVIGSGAYLSYRLLRAEGVLELFIPGLVAVVGASTLIAP